ncbi:hypothetical protein SPRG_17121, partial [Saprolegnia parasitica CBS 223.65]
SQAAGKYVLHFEEAPPGPDNLLFNWIGVVNGNTVCQTPTEKNAFAAQAVEHVAHNASTSALSDPVQYLQSLDTPARAVVGSVAALVVVVLVLVLVKVVRSRRTRYEPASVESNTPMRRRRASTTEEGKEEELTETASTRSAIAEIEGLMEPTTTMSLRPSMKLDTPMHPTRAKDHDAVFSSA